MLRRRAESKEIWFSRRIGKRGKIWRNFSAALAHSRVLRRGAESKEIGFSRRTDGGSEAQNQVLEAHWEEEGSFVCTSLRLSSAPAPVPIGTSINHGQILALVLSRIVSQSAWCCPAETAKMKIRFRPNLATSDAVNIPMGLAKLSVRVKWVVGEVLAQTERSCMNTQSSSVQRKSQQNPFMPTRQLKGEEGAWFKQK